MGCTHGMPPSAAIGYRLSAEDGETVRRRVASRKKANSQWPTADSQRPKARLFDGQGADHPRLLVPRDVTVVLVGAGRSVDDDLLGSPGSDIDADAECVDAEVVRRGALVGEADGDIGVGRDAQLLRLEEDVLGRDLDRLSRCLSAPGRSGGSGG